jgi:hypothetical protein
LIILRIGHHIRLTLAVGIIGIGIVVPIRIELVDVVWVIYVVRHTVMVTPFWRLLGKMT